MFFYVFSRNNKEKIKMPNIISINEAIKRIKFTRKVAQKVLKKIKTDVLEKDKHKLKMDLQFLKDELENNDFLGWQTVAYNQLRKKDIHQKYIDKFNLPKDINQTRFQINEELMSFSSDYTFVKLSISQIESHIKKKVRFKE